MTTTDGQQVENTCNWLHAVQFNPQQMNLIHDKHTVITTILQQTSTTPC